MNKNCLMPNEDSLLFYVKDSGDVIPQDQRKHIFERFRQVDDSTSRTQEGTGLGLIISNNLVKLLGGEMWLDSREGEGALFYFTLPYKTEPMKENKETRQEQYKEKGKILLIVEDDPASLEYMKELLEPHGFSLILCETGEKGYEAFLNNPEIDLVLLDLKLPDIDGLEVTQKIRASTHNNKVPVIAQTAYAMSEDAQKCISAGCDDYISKPFDSKELLEKIGKFI
ncbi:MAG: response regulator [Bacteroidales bacterium]